MGNSISSEEKAKQLERKILGYTGLKLDVELIICDVEIEFLGKNYIHTIKCGMDNSEVLVLLHGYAGSNLFYHHMLKDLSKNYKVFAIDLLGMALSSRPEFDYTTAEESIYFFVESLEKWRLKLGIDKFILGGHSFGGYMASLYTYKYPNQIKKLLLFSPLGFSKKDLNYNIDEDPRLKRIICCKNKIKGLIRASIRNRRTPSFLYQMFYPMAIAFLSKFFYSKRLNVSYELGSTLWEYMYETFKLPVSSDKAIHLVVNPNLCAYYSIEEFVDKLEIPILIMYGSHDWMDSSGARKVDQLGKHNFELKIIKDSGHQITFQNWKEVLKQISLSNFLDISLKYDVNNNEVNLIQIK